MFSMFASLIFLANAHAASIPSSHETSSSSYAAELNAKEFFEIIAPDENLKKALGMALKSILIEKFGEEIANSPTVDSFLESVASFDFDRIDSERIPQINSNSISQFRSVLGVLANDNSDIQEPSVDNEIPANIDLIKFINKDHCSHNLNGMTEISPEKMPGLLRGHLVDPKIDPCDIAQSKNLAKSLGALSLGKTKIQYNGKTFLETKKLIREIIKTGHNIELRNERMYADFLALAVQKNGATYISRIPLWMNTGIKLRNGNDLIVPTGHSHQAWIISGPLINARLMFYLGTKGVDFYPNVYERPRWSRESSRYTYHSSNNQRIILKSFETAANYSKLAEIESNTVALGYPSQGYGYVGVCNDSNALIESEIKSIEHNPSLVSTWPLARSADIKKMETEEFLRSLGLHKNGIALAKRLNSLHSDFDEECNTESCEFDRLRRIYAMQPEDPSLPSTYAWNSILKSELLEVKTALNSVTIPEGLWIGEADDCHFSFSNNEGNIQSSAFCDDEPAYVQTMMPESIHTNGGHIYNIDGDEIGQMRSNAASFTIVHKSSQVEFELTWKSDQTTDSNQMDLTIQYIGTDGDNNRKFNSTLLKVNQ